jgi:hypothetical protein
MLGYESFLVYPFKLVLKLKLKLEKKKCFWSFSIVESEKIKWG